MASQVSHLPHITNVHAGRERWDPMHQSIFEVGFTVPAALSDKGFSGEELEILTEQVVSINGLDALQKVAAANSQKFLGVDVSFLNPTLESTTAEFTIVFNLNLRNVTDNFVLKVFRAWENISYNLADGTRSIKTGYITDNLRIAEATRNGDIWRSYIFHHVMLTGVTNIDDLDIMSNDARQLVCTFRCDYWEDELS